MEIAGPSPAPNLELPSDPLKQPIEDAPLVNPAPTVGGSGTSAIPNGSIGATPGGVQAVGGAAQLGNQGEADFHTPDWVKDAIFYQVFPDRFKDGDTSNDPAGTVPWGTSPGNYTFEGGDLKGLQQSIPYLKSLGANAIYTTPVFDSPSNHKYDVTDFMHVDPAFGGDAAFSQYVDSAHSNGMHVILDGAFCNTSDQHPWFQNVIKNGQKSPYWNDYTVTHWPIATSVNADGQTVGGLPDANGVPRSADYKNWPGSPDITQDYASLPELNKANPAVEDYFVKGPNSVLAHWLTSGKIDGWRMDVAEDSSFPAGYWSTARQTLKTANPNAYFVAEDWHDATPLLASSPGGGFDGSMNYNYFMFPAQRFFAQKNISPDEFVKELQNSYPVEAQQAMLNSLDTHDTARFITVAGNDWYRLRPAAIFQMTYVGAPCIYYGDEIATEGSTDPDSRRPMDWSKVPTDVQNGTAAPQGVLNPESTDPNSTQTLDLYRRLAATRTAEPELRRGNFQVLETHDTDHTISYRRWIPGQQRDAIVAINNDVVWHGIAIPMNGVAPDGTQYTDALTGKQWTVQNNQIVIPNIDGNWGAVMIRDTPLTAADIARVAEKPVTPPAVAPVPRKHQ